MMAEQEQKCVTRSLFGISVIDRPADRFGDGGETRTDPPRHLPQRWNARLHPRFEISGDRLPRWPGRGVS